MAAPLTAGPLVDEAVAAAGPFPGDVPFLENLDRLLASCRATASLNPTGELVLRKAAVRHLRNLRAAQDLLAERPEVADLPLGSPLVVTGLPRTGTTLLHQLLALDPGFRPLRLWEALRPVPPVAGGPQVEARVDAAGRWLDSFYRLVPGFRAIHHATPTGPEECDALLRNAFASQHVDDMFDARDYSEWLGAASLSDEYAHYALQLRALTLASPPGSRWLLKSPGHLGHLPALVGALPGCVVVVCHRDPREAVASYASLIYTLRAAYSDTADPAVAGRQALARAALAAERSLDARATNDRTMFVDVSYRRLVADPVAAVRDVHPVAAERVRAWVAAHQQHGHGPHRYDLATFGLTPGDVDRAFARYLDTFAPLLAA